MRFFARLLVPLIVALATHALVATAAPYTFTHSEVRDLPTSANGRTYQLYVGYPASYFSEPSRKYPTLYFVDAYWDFALFSTVTGVLRADNALPEVLLIGIGYAGENPDIDRLRALDLTPGSDPFFDPSGQRTGHADEFLSVLRNEIIPLAERDYRADPTFRVLAGNSFGGLFTSYTAFQHPTLFQGYIASAPTLWWRNDFVHSLEAAYAQSHTSHPGRLYIAYASEDAPQMVRSARALYRQIQSHAYSNFPVAIREMEGERHSSLKPEAYTRGLRFVFAPRAPSPALKSTTMNASLIALATRGRVGTGDDVMIAGFIVEGLDAKRVLIQAGGPALARLGVPNFLADPFLRVPAGNGALLAENDNWSNDSAIASAAQQSGATAFASGSLDSALILTLPPGAYTAVVSGVNATTGNALVEVYELP